MDERNRRESEGKRKSGKRVSRHEPTVHQVLTTLTTQGLTWNEALKVSYEEMRLLVMQAQYKRKVEMLNEQILVCQQKMAMSDEGAKAITAQMRKLQQEIFNAEADFYGMVY